MTEQSTLSDLIAALVSPPEASTDVHQQIEVLLSSYGPLVNLIESSKPATRTEIETALSQAADVAAGSVGNWYVNAAWMRAIVGNPSYWEAMGTNAWMPSEGLMSSLNGTIARNEGGNNPYLPVAKGIREFISGRDSAAYDLFAGARKNALYARVIRDDWKGSSTCRPFPVLRNLTDHSLPFDLGKLEWHKKTPMGNSPYMISYSCDDVYFQAFSHHIVASLPADAAGINIHFHIVNPSIQGRALCDVVTESAAARGAALQITLENTHVKDRAYFCSCRFIRLHEFLDLFGRAMVLIDTDSEFKSDPREWCAGFKQDCVNVLFSRGPWGNGYLPWRALWAGMLFVPANLAGKKFALTLWQVIAYLWDGKQELNWWIDQNALYVTYRLLQRYLGPEGFSDIPSHRYSQVLTSEALKLQRLREVAQIGNMLETGTDWVTALRSVQLSK